MYATIQKWGNSHGLRIPKAVLESMDLHENDRVELTQNADCLTIQKAPAVRHRTLEQRLVAYYGKPIQEIGPLPPEEEVDWGRPEGQEL